MLRMSTTDYPRRIKILPRLTAGLLLLGVLGIGINLIKKEKNRFVGEYLFPTYETDQLFI